MATKIHHATAKKAQALGIVLSVDEDGRYVEAHSTTCPQQTQMFRMADAKSALVVCSVAEVLATEYPGLRLTQVDLDAPQVWSATQEASEDPMFEIEDPKSHDDLLADILEAADAAGIDPQEGAEEADEEDAAARVVVAEKYKQAYAERGNRNHCGDWLAKALDKQFDMSVDGVLRFDADAFTDCLLANGVELVGKWAALPSSGQKGWVGRYRMNGRQRLEFQVAKRGILTLRGDDIEVPADALVELRAKHPKAVAKLVEETMAIVDRVHPPVAEEKVEAPVAEEKPAKAKRSRKKVAEKVEA